MPHRICWLLLALAALLLSAACDLDRRSRVLIVGLDGLDPQTLDLLIAEGELPHFARLRAEGASAALASAPPLLSPVVWTTIATGRSPRDHGIGHFVTFTAGGEEIPVTSSQRRVESLWTIASRAGREVAVVGWWATWPPEAVRGTVVSDQLAYHFLLDAPAGSRADPVTYPPELREEIEPLRTVPDDLPTDILARFVDHGTAERSGPFRFEDPVAHLRWALATAASHRDIGLHLWRTRRPDLELVYVEATDTVAHLFGHLFRARGLAGDLGEQQRRYGRAVEEVYRFADGLVGEVLAALDERTTLLVLSDHGFRLGELPDDPGHALDVHRVSARFHRPEGVLFLSGRGVRPGARLDAPTTLDVAPTVLALLGLPAGADMPGRVLAEGLTLSRIPERIASWEPGGDSAQSAAVDPAIAEGIRDHLEDLGYLGSGGPEAGSSPGSERTMATLRFVEGDAAGAAAIYRRLLEADPDDAGLHASLAATLGALGEAEEALAAIERALALDPLNAEAYHNRAVLHERAGRPEAAVEDYLKALQARPDYEPSQRALARLAGGAHPPDAATEVERRALALCQEAAEAARRGDSEQAEELLDEAAALAPQLAVVHHYRANVAWLRGDLEATRAALLRALEIEPDNPLLQENLRRLETERRP